MIVTNYSCAEKSNSDGMDVQKEQFQVGEILAIGRVGQALCRRGSDCTRAGRLEGRVLLGAAGKAKGPGPRSSRDEDLLSASCNPPIIYPGNQPKGSA